MVVAVAGSEAEAGGAGLMAGVERPAGGYRVLYADPPWTFATYSDRGKGRSAEAHYDCMPLDAIKALPVRELAAEDAILLLWATDPLLPRAFEVIEAWGFAYKTVGFYWVKLNRGRTGPAFAEADFFTGLGFWTRANPETCLLATRGRPRRRAGAGDVRRLLVAPRREHSRKPDEAYARIEALAEGPYLELFARASRPGWHGWGLERGLFDPEGGSAAVRTRRRPSGGVPEP